MSKSKVKAKSAAPARNKSPKQIEQRSTLLNPIDAWLIDALGGGNQTASKQVVNANTAMWVPAWLAAIKCISEDVAKLPINIFLNENDTSLKQYNHPLQYLLNVAPNSEMSAMNFWETGVAHALAWKGFYSEIVRDQSGRAVALHPLDPTTVNPKRDSANNLIYTVQTNKGYIVLQQSQVLHIHGLSFDGIAGYDICNFAKEVIGNALSALKYSGSFFGNGANIGGLVSHPNVLDPKARENLRDALSQRYAGAENAHKIMVLEEGMKFEKTQIDPSKSMLIESLKFSVDDIARIFRIPAHKLGSLDRATFSNISEQNQNYIDETLMSWTVRIEQEIKRKLLLPSERNLDIKYSFADLLKGDNNSQADFYGKLFNNGFINQNEVCRRLGLPQLGSDGDKFYRPVQIIPVELPAPAPLAPSAAPQTSDSKGIAAQPGDDQAQRAIQTHTKLLAATLRRILKVEKDKVERYSKDFRGMDKIKAFYQDHGINRFGEIYDILESFQKNSNIEFDPTMEAKYILNEHISRSKFEAPDLNAVDKWLGSRADDFAIEQLNRIACGVNKVNRDNGDLVSVPLETNQDLEIEQIIGSVE